MSKELPYFKFIATEWLTGNICYEPFEVQGLFINICALYWNRGGILQISEIEQRYKKKAIIAKLSDRFFSLNDGFIRIEFLDEQLIERKALSERNSLNGKKGGRGNVKENKATANQEESHFKPKKSNIEEEEEEEYINISFDIFWDAYDKKVGEKVKLKKKWESLSDFDRQSIMDYIPKYKLSQPDKQYRKDPSTFFNNKSWKDELIFKKEATILIKRQLPPELQK